MFHSFSDALPVSQFRRPAHRAVRRPANPDDPAVRVHVHDVHDAGRQRAQLCREHPAGDGAESLAVQPVPAVRDGAGRHGNTRQHAARLHGWRRRNINSNWFIFLLVYRMFKHVGKPRSYLTVCPGQWVISSTVVQTRRGVGLQSLAEPVTRGCRLDPVPGGKRTLKAGDLAAAPLKLGWAGNKSGDFGEGGE